MKNIIKSSTLLFIAISALTLSCNQSSKNDEQTAKPTESEISETYVYLLGRTLAVRQEMMDITNAGLTFNTIKYNEPGKADFVNPNLDVAYMEAWFAMDENSAVILEIPEVKDRYYTAQLLDGWGEVIVNINERNFPDHPYGKFALCLENSKAEIPADARKIIMPVKKIKMLARVELQNTIAGAVALQKEFKVTVIGNPTIEPIIQFPSFTNNNLPDLDVYKFMDEFIKTPDSKFESADSLQQLCKKVAAYIGTSREHADSVKSVIRSKTIPTFIQYCISKAGKYENSWLGTLVVGDYKGNYWTRSAANFVGIWANTTDEVIYFVGSNDSNGQPLGSGHVYELKFEKDKLPINNVNAFWSIILVDFPGYRVVANELNRYNFNNYSNLVYEKDGSLKFYIAPTYNAKWPKSNWLPSPSDQKFNLSLRMYVPKENVRSGDWFPSAIKRIENN